MSLRIAMLSIHSSPIGRLGTKSTGGMSIYVRQLARHLGALNHPVDIFTCCAEQEAQALQHLYPNVRLIYIPGKAWGLAPSKNVLYDFRIRIADAIAGFSKDSGVNYDLIHSNYWLSGLVGRELQKRWRCPHCITFHTLGAAKVASYFGQKEHGERLAAEAGLMQDCDGVLAPTAVEKVCYAALHPGSAENIHIVPCGVDLEHFKPLNNPEVKEIISGELEQKTLLFVGRFDSMKGIDTLLESLSSLSGKPPVQLLLIGGDGPGNGAYLDIKAKVHALDLDKQVVFLGPVEHLSMVHYYNAADAVVVPSRYESFGLVIVESLACGIPVASMPVGIAPEVIQPGLNGYLAGAADAPNLATAIRQTLSLAEKGGPVKIHSTVSQFDWSQVACTLLDVYHTIIKGKFIQTENQGQPGTAHD